jgi:hypothetical protein
MTLAPSARPFPQIAGISADACSVRTMSTAASRKLGAVLALALASALVGCGKSGIAPPAGPAAKLAPVAAQGTVSVTTRNTTRLGGADAASDAAAVARTVYPGFTAATRPQAVVLVNERDWAGALAASALASAPLSAPLLYATVTGSLPAVSTQTLQSMHPSGASALGGAQVIEIGGAATLPGNYLVHSLRASEPAAQAVEVQRLLLTADGGTAPRQVIVLIAGAPRALQMPAAGLAAESGAPILFVTAARVPRATAQALAGLHHPAIYVIGSSPTDAPVLHRLRRFGSVTKIVAPAGEGRGAVANALAIARFTNGTFGWGVKEPGHGLVFANSGRPLDGPAAALLSATGDYGPLLLLEYASQISPALAKYLGDIQPAYTTNTPAVKGVYNHGWLIGDEHAISAVAQAEIDSLLEISPRPENAPEAPVE